MYDILTEMQRAIFLLILIISLPAAAQLGVFGDDNREAYWHADMEQQALRNVGLLKISRQTPYGIQSAQCSGFLVTPRLVVTAAHCLSMPGNDIDADITVEFLLQYNGQPLPDNKVFTGKKLLSSDEWLNAKNVDISILQYDYAAVVLDRRAQVRGLPVAMVDDLQKQPSVAIVGYPGTKAGKLFFANTNQYRAREGLLQHDGDIEPGQSGGPVIWENKVIGIHSHMTDQYNASVLLDTAALKQVKKWMRRYD